MGSNCHPKCQYSHHCQSFVLYLASSCLDPQGSPSKFAMDESLVQHLFFLERRLEDEPDFKLTKISTGQDYIETERDNLYKELKVSINVTDRNEKRLHLEDHEDTSYRPNNEAPPARPCSARARAASPPAPHSGELSAPAGPSSPQSGDRDSSGELSDDPRIPRVNSTREILIWI